MTQTSDIVIAGGGIIGLCSALHCAAAGMTVTLIDPLPPGAATTGAGAGFVSHWSAGFLPAFGLAGFTMQDYALKFYRNLQSEGFEIGYRQAGTLVLARDEEEERKFLDPILHSPLSPGGLRRLKPMEVASLTLNVVEPAAIYSAVLNAHGIQIETTLAAQAIAAKLADLGTSMITARVVDWVAGDAGVDLTDDKGEKYHCKTAVLAGGAWNNTLLRPSGWRAPYVRMVATRIVTAHRGIPKTIPTIQCPGLELWLRECDGALTWGTSKGYAPAYHFEADQAPGQPRYPVLVDCLNSQRIQELTELFPPLKRGEIREWRQGLVCYTPDDNLVVGHVPGYSNVLVAGGDNETGVSHAPGIGRVVSEMIRETRCFVDTTDFMPARFGLDFKPSEQDIALAMPLAFSFKYRSAHQ